VRFVIELFPPNDIARISDHDRPQVRSYRVLIHTDIGLYVI
jgi:hypothetical protein